jgi:branched-chain amino acid transport system ATP-binding protein
VLRGVDLHVISRRRDRRAAGQQRRRQVDAEQHRLRPGAAWAGPRAFDGQDLTRAHYREVVQAGLIQVPEGRRIFPNLTVRENLELGARSPAPANAAARQPRPGVRRSSRA